MTLPPVLPITIRLAGAMLCILFRSSLILQKWLRLRFSFLLLLPARCLLVRTCKARMAAINGGT